MSKAADPAVLFARLPAAARSRLEAIGREARDLFGDLRDHQRLFDAHVTFFDALAAAGVRHAALGLLLAAAGVRRADGRPLSRGTISSGLSRARERAAARPLLHSAAASGGMRQHDAACTVPLHAAAASGRKAAANPRPPNCGAAAPLTADTPASAPARTARSPTTPTAIRNLRAAALLNMIRSNS